MKRGGPLRRRTPLRADAETQRDWQRRSQDAARARERATPRVHTDAIPADVRAAVNERAGGRCEAQLEGCRGRAEHLHHRKRRGQGGAHTPENLVALCGVGGCHDWIHGHPAEAQRLGLLLRSSEPLPTVAWQRLPADGD